MDLDARIELALTTAAAPLADEDSLLDYDRYRRAFASSAQAKGQAVLDELKREPYFAQKRPLFVSIGGADGEEAEYLLGHSQGSIALLLEKSRVLAQKARERRLPLGKRIEVFEGDASDAITEVIQRSEAIVRADEADYRAVSCHAVIHELYDRSPGFDPITFFAQIFAPDEVTTWFTYREPGVPEKWPDFVYLAADCSPKTLLSLAKFIESRHPSLRNPKRLASIVGDKLLVSRALASELLSKLFYLDDLRYEIEERSSSVDHSALAKLLFQAVGEKATLEGRTTVMPRSSPTDSFTRLWREFGIQAWSFDQSGNTARLPIPESHTRMIAWRLSEDDSQELRRPEIKGVAEGDGEINRADILLAQDALQSGDLELLQALLLSKGRSWIELVEQGGALHLLNQTMALQERSLSGIWCRYLLGLVKLFSGDMEGRHYFSDHWEEAALPHGLAPLFRAERMEFARKSGERDQALDLATVILSPAVPSPPASAALGRYVEGTVHFVLNNFLRYGGLYDAARLEVGRAKSLLLPGIESHATELVHCRYAESVCDSLKGTPSFESALELPEVSQRFAGALIQLSSVNAAWFVHDLDRARRFAAAAADQFEDIGAVGYVKRAQTLASLLDSWQALEKGYEVEADNLPEDLATGILAISGRRDIDSSFRDWFAELRPSVAAGLLQFQEFDDSGRNTPIEVPVPRYLEVPQDGCLKWSSAELVRSLADAEQLLRKVLGARDGVRIPLYPD